MTKYCLDTGVFINGWQKHYLPAIAPSFWTFISDGLANGSLILPREVYEEIENKNDDLFKWVKARSELVRDTTEEVVLALKQIMQHEEYCQIVKAKGSARSGADPWVIAHARTWQATVVTEEGRKGKTPRIPDVCEGLGIPCISTVDMLGAEKFKF